MIFAIMSLSSGCEKKTTDPTAESTLGSTKLLQAADLVGYDGTKLGRNVDHIKAANDRHNQELEKIAGTAPEQ